MIAFYLCFALLTTNINWLNANTHHPQTTMDIIVDPFILKTQREALEAQKAPPSFLFSPLSQVSYTGNPEDRELGLQLLKQGVMGCVVLAGGQGTRLHFEGPKGLYPISPVKEKTLFQLIAEKTAAASAWAGTPLPLAIMTSPLNHQNTVSYFEKNHYFGLDPAQVSFFPQEMLPFLDQEGNPFLEDTETVACGPDGNGHVFVHFYENGLWDTWKNRGIRYVNLVLIDNPLADPFDVELLGFQARKEADVVVKCTLRSQPNEKVGLLVEVDGQPRVIEYSEAPVEQTSLTTSDGSLVYPYANLSLFSFSMDFISLTPTFPMPLHAALKPAKCLSTGKETLAWKFEWFIFDVLPFAKNCKVLAFPRKECFSPLKNAEGPDSPQVVKDALSTHDRELFEAISGTPVLLDPFELSAAFHYPTQELLERWKGRAAPGKYVAENN